MIHDLVAIYRACFHATIAIQLQYRLSLVIWLIGLVVQPTVYLVVWRTVAGSGSVGGYDAGDFAAYYLVLMIVNHATFSWIMYEYDFEIRQGNLSAKLLKPANPVHMHLADNLSYKLITMVVVLPTAGLLALYFKPNLSLSVAQVGMFLVALVLAFALRWILEYTLALAAFWTTRVSSVNNIYFGISWFVSGMVAPTALLPEFLQSLAMVLPFRYGLGFPIEVLLGRVTGTDALLGFAGQIVWIVVGLILYAIVWRVGMRRYSAVGA